MTRSIWSAGRPPSPSIEPERAYSEVPTNDAAPTTSTAVRSEDRASWRTRPAR
jgi:hypothetical protein